MADTEQTNAIKNRVASIDALRGFDMFWIIGGGIVFRKLSEIYDNASMKPFFAQFHHVEWEGFHFWDLIFPLFLFIVGAVLPFSIARRVEKGESRLKLLKHITKRMLVLILLGLIYNKVQELNFADIRLFGILPRIGVSYFVAALLMMYTTWRMQATITIVILVFYWGLITFVPVPGLGAGCITFEASLVTYIDKLLLPENMLAGYPAILANLPSVATVLMGALAGYWLRTDRSGSSKATGLIAGGIACLAAGYLWGLFFPIIKIIWTSSYTLVAGGWSLILLALFYWIIDVRGHKKWAFFFVVIGMNPLTIYFLQRFVDFEAITKFFVSGAAKYTGAFEAVVLAVGVLAVKWGLLWFLYRRRIFFKV